MIMMGTMVVCFGQNIVIAPATKMFASDKELMSFDLKVVDEKLEISIAFIFFQFRPLK